MERRTILVGSATALATGLAGCTDLLSSDETSDAPDDDHGNDDYGDDDYGDDSDPKDDKDGDDDKETKYQPIPGLDDLDIDDEDIEIAYAKHSGGDVKIGINVEKHPDDVTRADLEKYAGALAHAVEKHIDKYEQFKSQVDTLTITIYDRWDEVVVQFYLNVEWLLAYIDDELDLEELVEKALDKHK